MKVQVIDDKGTVVFESDDEAPMIATRALKTEIAGALSSAAESLLSDHPIIETIKADIQATIGRIETELGAHPAFTWAQTMLSNARAHLEHYAAGVWIEPDQHIEARVVRDVRGVILSVTPPPAA